MIRYQLFLFLLFSSLTITSCSSKRETAEFIGIAGIWEVDLSQDSINSTHKGQVVFKGNRYVYTWYQLLEGSNIQSTEWRAIEMEQGNIIVEKPGVMMLLADSYGIPDRSGNSRSQDKTEYVIKPSKSDYLIHYEIKNDELDWMEDSNFDGDFDDVNEMFIYTRIN